MKKQPAKKLGLTRVTVQRLQEAAGGRSGIQSYGAWCSGSCNSCDDTCGCETLYLDGMTACISG